MVAKGKSRIARGASARRQFAATVDRIEGEFAVLDAGGVVVRVPHIWLPDGSREGSGLTITIAPGDARPLERSVRDRLARLTRGG